MEVDPHKITVNGTPLGVILAHYRNIGVLVDALKESRDWYTLRAWDDVRCTKSHAKVELELLFEEE